MQSPTLLGSLPLNFNLAFFRAQVKESWLGKPEQVGNWRFSSSLV